MNGTVTRVAADKGFGFIRAEDGDSYFFHRTDVDGFFNDLAADVNRGMKVEVTFDPVNSQKGPRASKVSRNDWPNQST